MEYSLATKRTEVLIHAATWMNLKDSMLCKRNQTQKATFCMILFMCNVQNVHICGDMNRLSVA